MIVCRHCKITMRYFWIALNWRKVKLTVSDCRSICDRLLLFPLRMGTRVFVGGLTYRVRERDLEKFFRKYGRIKEVAMKNGFAFVVSC